jgi:excisionase family DNA binding protein
VVYILSLLDKGGVMRLLTAPEVQELLGFKSVQTVYRWVRDGRIGAVRFGARSIRFCADEIEKAIYPGVQFINLEAGKPIPVRTVTRRRIRAWEE